MFKKNHSFVIIHPRQRQKVNESTNKFKTDIKTIPYPNYTMRIRYAILIRVLHCKAVSHARRMRVNIRTSHIRSCVYLITWQGMRTGPSCMYYAIDSILLHICKCICIIYIVHIYIVYMCMWLCIVRKTLKYLSLVKSMCSLDQGTKRKRTSWNLSLIDRNT